MTSAERGREGGTQILMVGGGGCVISIVTILTRGGRGPKIITNGQTLAILISDQRKGGCMNLVLTRGREGV